MSCNLNEGRKLRITGLHTAQNGNTEYAMPLTRLEAKSAPMRQPLSQKVAFVSRVTVDEVHGEEVVAGMEGARIVDALARRAGCHNSGPPRRPTDAPHARMIEAPGVVHTEMSARAAVSMRAAGKRGGKWRAKRGESITRTLVRIAQRIQSEGKLGRPARLAAELRRRHAKGRIPRRARGGRADSEAALERTAEDAELEDGRAADAASVRAPGRSVGDSPARLRVAHCTVVVEFPHQQPRSSPSTVPSLNAHHRVFCGSHRKSRPRRVGGIPSACGGGSAPHEAEPCGCASSNRAVFSRSTHPSHSRGTTSARTRQQRAYTESHEERVPPLREAHKPVSMRWPFAPKSPHFSTSNRITASTQRGPTEQCALNYTTTSTRTRPAVVRRLADGPVFRPALLHDATLAAGAPRGVRRDGGDPHAGCKPQASLRCELGVLVLDSRGETEVEVGVYGYVSAHSSKRRRDAALRDVRRARERLTASARPHAARAGTPANPRGVVRARLMITSMVTSGECRDLEG
ncbi:hypothetical protein FB451DRAFT_1481260 [Mycena latifolia]|nr:hypothetical protein FB451DRAFT_1481260 [Mycena latifolia]